MAYTSDHPRSPHSDVPGASQPARFRSKRLRDALRYLDSSRSNLEVATARLKSQNDDLEKAVKKPLETSTTSKKFG